jgi:hypothetical protein
MLEAIRDHKNVRVESNRNEEKKIREISHARISIISVPSRTIILIHESTQICVTVSRLSFVLIMKSVSVVVIVILTFFSQGADGRRIHHGHHKKPHQGIASRLSR